jgi:hypothetical protein
VRGMLIGGVGWMVGGLSVYGGGCCDSGEVVLGRRGWWPKDDGKQFGRRWIRVESIVFSGPFSVALPGLGRLRLVVVVVMLVMISMLIMLTKWMMIALVMVAVVDRELFMWRIWERDRSLIYV